MSGQLSNNIDVQLGSAPYIVRSETNQRENNEDSFQISEIVPAPGRAPITILAVADGMGGHAYGEIVSREALRKLSLALYERLTVEPSLNRLDEPLSNDVQTVSQALMDALEQTNAYVRRMVETNKWGKAGSTVVVAAVLEDIAVVANLGDSPLFHYQASSKQLAKVTQDHTVAGVLLRAKLITPEMARYHEGRNRLEFYLGCPSLPEDDPIHQVRLAPGDILLLCSDGVNGSVSDAQIRSILAESDEVLERIAERLFQTARDAGETDNQTLILWQHQVRTGALNQAVKVLQSSQETAENIEKQGGTGFKTIIQSGSTLRQSDEQFNAQAVADLIKQSRSSLEGSQNQALAGGETSDQTATKDDTLDGTGEAAEENQPAALSESYERQQLEVNETEVKLTTKSGSKARKKTGSKSAKQTR